VGVEDVEVGGVTGDDEETDVDGRGAVSSCRFEEGPQAQMERKVHMVFPVACGRPTRGRGARSFS